jgi:hypothetical protein
MLATLTAYCVPALQRLVFDAVSVVEAAYGMGIPSTRCATLLREYLWALRGGESSYPPYAPNKRHLPGLSREAEGVSIPWEKWYAELANISDLPCWNATGNRVNLSAAHGALRRDPFLRSPLVPKRQ